MNPPTFEQDVAFMRAHGPVEVLAATAGGRIAVSALWQGRVMTSTVDAGGRSLGFVNRAFIAAGRTGTQFDNYGGEDRFWLGPEGGQNGLFFAPQAPFELDTWQVPHALQEGPWATGRATASSVTFTREMKVASRAGTEFHVAVEREVAILDEDAVAARFGVALAPGVPAAAGAVGTAGAKSVAFETVNRVTNVGSRAWSRADGLLSIWILGQYPASTDSVVIVPFVAGAHGAIVNDRYFGEVPSDRLVVHPRDGYLVFKADGRHRSKIGLGPARARPTLGSFSRDARLLTLVRYDRPAGRHDYVNSLWEMQEDPYDGDVVNSYNDGPVDAGRPVLGAFFELETSSPAAGLAPGESFTHAHATLHVEAPVEALDPLALRTLGVSLDAVR
jgi:hypothetical protein